MGFAHTSGSCVGVLIVCRLAYPPHKITFGILAACWLSSQYQSSHSTSGFCFLQSVQDMTEDKTEETESTEQRQ